MQTLWVDPYRDLKTLRHDLTIDRGVSFEAAMRRLDFERKACALPLNFDAAMPGTLFHSLHVVSGHEVPACMHA